MRKPRLGRGLRKLGCAVAGPSEGLASRHARRLGEFGPCRKARDAALRPGSYRGNGRRTFSTVSCPARRPTSSPASFEKR